jgi:cytochrome c
MPAHRHEPRAGPAARPRDRKSVDSIQGRGSAIMKLDLVALAFGGILALGSATAGAALDDAKAEKLMNLGGCSTCHAVERKLIGPAYKDVAARHKGEPDAVAKLEKSVRGGSKDVYGKMPMPPTPADRLGNAELHDLLEWIMTK